MIKSPPETASKSPKKAHHHSKQNKGSLSRTCSYSPKLSVFILISFATLFILLHIKFSLQIPPAYKPSPRWTTLMHQYWQKSIFNTTNTTLTSSANDQESAISEKLRQSVTFLPVKDLRYSNVPLQGHTWFMSSLYDTHENGEVQYQQFPSKASQNRLLCLKGRDFHDGSWNYYALAWPEALPYNSTIMKGLTFISYNHYDYGNIWHGISAMFPFVAWHKMSNCSKPSRWVLFHWGELRLSMSPWLKTVLEATFGGPPHIEDFDGVGIEERPVCFEKAVVMRHNEGGMLREKRMEVYDLMRCRIKMYCNVSLEGRLEEVNEKGLPVIGMTLLMRRGARSFKNETIVAEIFKRECAKVENCRFVAAHSENLTFCEQVKLMSLTDILISPHGAQMTNSFMMDRNSSIMEFFPKGWKELAGVGQLVFRWMASWSGMKHQGYWHDPVGDPCPYPENDRRCMSVYKNGRIGYNETQFSDWARNVLAEVKARKLEEASRRSTAPASVGCACG